MAGMSEYPLYSHLSQRSLSFVLWIRMLSFYRAEHAAITYFDYILF